MIKSYTKKPVVIQALQWTGSNLEEIITFTDGSPDVRSEHADMKWEEYKDLVAVPRDLIGAACSAIDKKRDGARTLAELRRYTVGDLSAAITSAPQADSQPALATQQAGAAKENLRLVRVIADKIEDGTLFQSGIYSKKDLARFVRNVADAAAPQPSPTAQADSQPGDKDLVEKEGLKIYTLEGKMNANVGGLYH